MGFCVLAMLSCRWRWPWLSCAEICRAAGYILGVNEQQLVVGWSGEYGNRQPVAGFFLWIRSWHSPLVRAQMLSSLSLIKGTAQSRATFSAVFLWLSSLWNSWIQKNSGLCYLAYIHCPLPRDHLRCGWFFLKKWDVSFTLNQMYKAAVHNTQHYCKLERKQTFIPQSLLAAITSWVVPYIPYTVQRALSNWIQCHKLK